MKAKVDTALNTALAICFVALITTPGADTRAAK